MKTIVNAALVAALVSVGVSASAQSGGLDVTYTSSLTTEGSAGNIAPNGASAVIYPYDTFPHAKVSGFVLGKITYTGATPPKRVSYVAQAITKKTINGVTSEKVIPIPWDGAMPPNGLYVTSPNFNAKVLRSSNPRNFENVSLILNFVV